MDHWWDTRSGIELAGQATQGKKQNVVLGLHEVDLNDLYREHLGLKGKHLPLAIAC